ncbi:FAD-dependent oxidoreductase, partial [Pseudomonas sp. CrR25]|nr:FAD-dependent oxidoreductase [Pseudomonas sp. CrR25]
MNHYDLLLIGAGHAHLGVLRRWALNERPPGRIGLLSPEWAAWYSGMLPGLLAGRFGASDCQVELQPLCRAAKVELIIGRAASLDAVQRQVQVADGRTLAAGLLSLNLGAQVARPPQQSEAMQLLAVKPFAEFLAGWQRWQADPQPLAILGGGAAGVELALALADRVPQLALFCAGQLLAGHNAGLHLRALGHLRQRRVRVREHCPIERIDGDQLLSGGEPVWRGSRLLLASGAEALPWLAQSGLDCDEGGFVRIGATLQSLSHPQVLAVGDCAGLPGARKSGVYAVRQAPVLAANLNALLRGLPLRAYRPQRHSLALLATGDGGALLGWRQWSAGGQFC